MAERKFTSETVIKWMVLVRKFVLATVLVMALFFRKKFAQMLVGMH